eukprot:m51a1_g11895 putative uracil-dna glycosylase (377) ;mRNA; r:602935-604148
MDATELEKKTVVQLQALCRERKLPVGGNKAAIVERLAKYQPAADDRKASDDDDDDDSGSKDDAPEPPKKSGSKLKDGSLDQFLGIKNKREAQRQPQGEPPAKKPKQSDDDGHDDGSDEGDAPAEPAAACTSGAAATVATVTAEQAAASAEDPLASLVEPTWRAALADEFAKPYFKSLMKFVVAERKKANVFPPPEDVWTAFNMTPLDKVRVVILGQDPYFNQGEAHGLCFSVRRGVKVPPSLNRIYAELARCVPGFRKPTHGCLESWARQGVFMLNATLTVEQKKPNSHAKSGWQQFTDRVVQLLNERREGLVYMLWGSFAQKKGKAINRSKNTVLEAPHPSPLGGSGFNNCAHFRKANDVIVAAGGQPIDWSPDK